MLCSECETREATVLLKILVDNRLTQHALCAACAARKEAEVVAAPAFLLSALLAHIAGVPVRGARAVRSLRCAGCGMEYAEFRRTGRLGCAVCYDAFRDALGPLLVKVHGASAHVGKGAGA